MKCSLAQRIQSCLLIAFVVCTTLPAAQADPIPVRYTQGALHGFLEMRSEGGLVLATGDATQFTKGDRVISETLFKFKDGSVDDETTIYTQHRAFQLISDHHVQKGPTFPHPMDVMVDARSGRVTVRTTGKDGKEEVKTDYVNLPSDLANGLVPILLQNLRANEQGATVSMVVATPKPRMVKLVITNRGQESYSLVGMRREATHYEIKVELGGLAGVVAPLIDKAPPNIQIWVIRGEASTFAREIGPLYPEGPMTTIQLASPTWPQSPKSSN